MPRSPARAAFLSAAVIVACAAVSGWIAQPPSGDASPRSAEANAVTQDAYAESAYAPAAVTEQQVLDLPASTKQPTAKPSPSASATPKSTTGTTTTAGALTTPSATAPAKACRRSVPVQRATAHGTGPAGSVSVTGSQSVALTFDDGPDPINTPKLLDLLAACGVKATFCLVGFRARNHPDLVARIANEGHTLCNHSWQHLFDLGADARTDEYIRHDLAATNTVIQRAAPQAKISYFRAPGGNFTPRLVQIAHDLGMTSLYWSLDPRDWESSKYGTGPAMVGHVIGAVQRDVRPGSIVLSHDNGKPDTVTAYRTLLPWLKARFQLVALPT